ncbi:MAG TPA: ABC transporter substrate-binding protein, partial [Candidatus Limnocylindrales bacterium]|nr:ABC transporter substrate-binding protein [Candidatus Limnocylindrales bacterium]
VRAFNKKHQDEGLSARLVEFPESADQQRTQFIQRQQAGSGDCDVFYSDVIWTAEFASQNWLYDMTPVVEERRDEFIPSTLETIRYDGRYWGLPKQTDAGFLYYRTDQVEDLPQTWQGVYELAEREDQIVYQGARYEGLTVNFLELALANGGRVLSEDGKQSEFDSPENLEALEFMVQGVRDRAAPRAVVTYMEEQARREFQGGRATFMRNWPYAYALAKRKGSDIRNRFAVAPLPAFEGAGTAGVLGGHNLVISAHSKNPGGALRLVDYLTSPEAMERDAAKYSLAPTLRETYTDPDVQDAMPFASELEQAVEQAKSRPVTPVYPQVSQAIYENVYRALTGAAQPDEALAQADRDIEDALDTF